MTQHYSPQGAPFVSEPLSLAVIGRVKDCFHAFVACQKRLKGRAYIDVRIEVSGGKGGDAKNDTAKRRVTPMPNSPWAFGSMPVSV
jgi:hypothetical protein